MDLELSRGPMFRKARQRIESVKQSDISNREYRLRRLLNTVRLEIGQQALVDAEGAEESQGRKDHGIRQPCLRRQRLLWQA